MKRMERPGWFAAGAAAMAIAAMLAVEIPGREPAVGEELVADPQSGPELVLQLEQINERLGRLEQSRAGTDDAAESAQPETVPKPKEYEASMAAGREIVDRAIQAGSWTHRDAAEFGAATATLELPDRLVLHQRLVAAVNEDRVQMQGPSWQR